MQMSKSETYRTQEVAMSYAGRKIKLVFHYLDNDCISKGIWIWTRVSRRDFYPFRVVNDGYGNKVAECDIYIYSENENVDFKVTRIGDSFENSTLKDGGIRRIEIFPQFLKDERLDVYALSEDQSSKIFYTKPKIVEFWYKRRLNDYNGWKLHIFNTENFIDGIRDIKDRKVDVDKNYIKSLGVHNEWKKHASVNEDLGSNFKFIYDKNCTENEGYAISRVPFEIYEGENKKLWFKLHRNDWNDFDVFINRSIYLNDFKNQDLIKVYLIEKDIKKYFNKPDIKHMKVNLHYKRFENDYFGWTVMYFLDELNNNVKNVSDFNKSSYGDFQKVSFEIDYLEENKKLDFYLRNGGEADFQEFRSISLQNKTVDVFVVEEEFEVFYHYEEAKKKLEPKITKAIMETQYGDNNYCVIWGETNVPIGLSHIGTNLNFEVMSDQSETILVKKVNYSDASRRRFKIMLENNKMKPFERRYTLSIKATNKKSKLSFRKGKRVDIVRMYNYNEFNEKYVYANGNLTKDFGATLGKNSLIFRLWSPLSDAVNVKIYEDGEGGEPVETMALEYNQGVWEKEVSSQYVGMFYTYEISYDGEISEIVDPYAKGCGINAKRGAIIDFEKTNPTGFHHHKRPEGEAKHPIIYEMSIKDFTSGIGSDVSKEKKGKYLGVCEKIDHLKRLGVNTVQLLPVMKFESDEDHVEGGIYNWGYDQLGYWFLLEGIYTSNPYDPYTRIREFKQMIKTLHENDIRVVIDVVYNHTFYTETSYFNKIIPSYFYRLSWNDYFVNGSGCGNEIKSEHPMVQKMIRDSILFWVKEMGVDGFRFDLMSLIDKFTMEKIRKDVDSINPNILIYGEAYIMGWTSLSRSLQSSKENINSKELRGVGSFADIGSRNAIRGYNFEVGLVNGDPKDSNASFRFYVGQKGEFIEPAARNNDVRQIINYIDCHDDLLFIDFLNIASRHISKSEKFKRYKLAYSLLFNYIGAIMIKSGVEGITTKLGDHNSYKTFLVNLIDWDRMKRYDDIVEYFSQYLRFRQSHSAYMMNREEVHSKFVPIDSNNGYVKGKMFKNHANGDIFEKIVIFHNLSNLDLSVDLPEEESGWALVGDYRTIGNHMIRDIADHRIVIPALTTYILADKKSVLHYQTEVNDKIQSV
jgi:pullulanase